MARYQNPKLKDQTYPDLPEIRKHLQKCDKDKETERDVRPLMSLLMRMIEASPRLGGHQLTRRTAVTAYDWDFIADDPADKDRAIAAKTRLRSTVNAILNRHHQTPLYGALAVRLESTLVNGQIITRAKRRYRPDEIERVGDDLDQIAIVQSEGTAITREHPTNPQEWVLETDDQMFVHGGILRTLAFHERLRVDTMMEWANYNLKVKGIVMAKLAEYAGDDDKLVAKQSLANLRQHGYSVTSNAVDYDYQQTVAQVGALSLKDMKQTIDDDESIALLGQANTAQLPKGGGSRAALEVLNYIRADIHFSDIVRLEQTVLPQLLLIDHQLNNERAALVCPWRFAFRMHEDRDIEKEIRAIAEALDAGVPLKKSEVYERIGYTMPEGEEDEYFTGSGATLPIVESVNV